MIEKSEAIVLGARRYSESSKIVTLLTKSRGKVSVMAKGAMRLKSQFAGQLESMAHLSTVVYHKEGRSLQNLSSAETVERYKYISQDLDRLSVGLTTIELVNNVALEDQRSDELFEVTVHILQLLNETINVPDVIETEFRLTLLNILGYGLAINRCALCDEQLNTRETREFVFFSHAAGGFLCLEHSHSLPSEQVTSQILELFRRLDRDPVPLRDGTGVDLSDCAVASNLMRTFLTYHVEGLRRPKVERVRSQMGRNLSP